MSDRISRLQVVDKKYWNNLQGEDHLGAIGALEPTLISKTIAKLHKSTYGSDDFVSFTNKFPVRYIDEDVPFRWMLQDVEERNYQIIKATIDADGTTEISSTDKAGVGHGRFYMWFGEEAFSATSVIVGENPDAYSLRVVTDPVVYGDGLVRFEVELVTGNQELFVPYEDLQGTLWSEEYGLVEFSRSKRGNGISGQSNFMLENVLSMIRKNYEVGGDMISKGRNKPMAFAFMDANGEMHTRWIDMLGWNFMIQFRRDIARLLLYGKSNRMDNGQFANKGESGNTIRAGYGMYEQLEGSNEASFNVFNIDALTEFALDISVGKVAEDDRTFLLSAGEYGAYEFHKAVENKAGSITYVRDNNRISAKDGKLSLNGGQFIEYKTVNGLTFKIMIDPIKDNKTRNKKRDKKGRLLSSLVFDLLDFGTSNGESNIYRVYQKGDEEIYGYRKGMRDPFNPYNKTTVSREITSSVDSYEVYGMFKGGMQVNNPLKTFRYYPSELLG